MTLRDPEILELLGDEPELLALADAIRETQQARPSRLRAHAPLRYLAPAVALAAIIAVAILLVPDRVARPGVIGRALAAIGDGRVLHLRTQTDSGLVYVNLKTGHRTVVMQQDELWYDRQTHRMHYLEEIGGKVADVVWPDDAKSGVTLEQSAPDPAFTALWSGYRDALSNGTAKLERDGFVDGHQVYWLRFPSVRSGIPGTEVAIDRTTYKPVLFRDFEQNGRHVDERVLVAETVGFTEANFKHRGPSLFDGETSSGGYSTESQSTRPVVKPPWVTAGSTVIGLPLSTVSELTNTTQGRTAHGVVLVYGSGDREPSELTVEELRQADIPASWKTIPREAVAIQTSIDVGTGNKTTKRWTGSLVKDGVYATIETSHGEKAVLTVARALRRAP